MTATPDRPGSRRRRRRLVLRIAAAAALAVVVAGFLLPQHAIVPVRGDTANDWNPKSFWYFPWGRSGAHKGIDIFAAKGTPVVAATPGLVVVAGTIEKGGNVVAILGPKWRIHYYAHLDTIRARPGVFVREGDGIGTVGATGNAAGKPPHLHYSIMTPVPYPWRIGRVPQGWKRMFYLDPGEAIGGTLHHPQDENDDEHPSNAPRRMREGGLKAGRCRAHPSSRTSPPATQRAASPVR